MREMITVREADHELRIQVLDARAYVAIVPLGADVDPEGPGRTVSLPARRLHALLRAAWADDQFGSGGPLDPPLWPMSEPEPEEDPYAEERLLFGWREDWPEAWDIAGGGHGEVLPFPFRPPAPPPRPANGGLPWSAEDDAALREAWLAADPGASRTVVLDELAGRFARTPGAVTARLYRVGCDPSVRGTACMEPITRGPGSSA